MTIALPQSCGICPRIHHHSFLPSKFIYFSNRRRPVQALSFKSFRSFPFSTASGTVVDIGGNHTGCTDLQECFISKPFSGFIPSKLDIEIGDDPNGCDHGYDSWPREEGYYFRLFNLGKKKAAKTPKPLEKISSEGEIHFPYYAPSTLGESSWFGFGSPSKHGPEATNSEVDSLGEMSGETDEFLYNPLAPINMIQQETRLNVADNSGAQELLCIRILGGSNPKYAHIGDVIVAVVKDAAPNASVKRSEVVRPVVVRTCKELKRENGMIIRYDDNAAVVIDKDGNPKGTRIFGAIPRELRQLNFTKIVSLAPEVL